jgi:hypothetical protein
MVLVYQFSNHFMGTTYALHVNKFSPELGIGDFKKTRLLSSLRVDLKVFSHTTSAAHSVKQALQLAVAL